MRTIMAALIFMSFLVSAHAVPGIPTASAGEYSMREMAEPANQYNDPPSYVAAGWEEARVATISYKDGAVTDVYWPARESGAPLPVILVAFKYSASKFVSTYGKPFRTMAPTIIWMAQMANLGYVVVCPDVSAAGQDMARVMAWIAERGPSLGMDASRLGLLAFSANAEMVPYLMTTPGAGNVKVILLYYPLVLPSAWSIDRAVAVHIVKAGKDDANLNNRLDMLARNLRDAGNTVDLVTYANGRHSFDVHDRTAEAAAAMRATHDFIRAYLK